MHAVTLAYRDDDRAPVIFAIRRAAMEFYDLEVRVAKIKGGAQYEAALFNGSADIVIEHLEYLYQEAARGKKIVFFCAPSKGGGLHLVAPQEVRSIADLRGKVLAVRSQGQPHAVTLWLRMTGLEKDVATVIVDDSEVGRWGQWKKVLSGECIATFMSPLYLPQALAAGLKILPAAEIPIVGQFAQACLAEFARARAEALRAYVQSVLHALAWLTLRPDEAWAALRDELRACMNSDDESEHRRRFHVVVAGLKLKPYPTPQAIANTYEIATLEYPEAKGLNPLCLWDLHWVKELDDSGFIDRLVDSFRS